MDFVHPSVIETLFISLIGISTVFVVLVALMAIIKLMSAFVQKLNGKQAPTTEAVPAAHAAPATPVSAYTGVKLEGVSDRDAAVIMAIVAHQLQKPLEQLQFISIREGK